MTNIVYGIITFVIIAIIGFVGIGSTYFMFKDEMDERSELCRENTLL